MVDSRYFLFSFLAVGAHYAAWFLGLLVLLFLIMKLAWPVPYELWTLPAERQAEFLHIWEQQPEVLFPAGLCWTLIVAGSAFAIVLGISLARFVPFSPAGHGILLAVLCLVTFLQIAMTQPQLPRWLMGGLMIGSAAGMVAGSRLGAHWIAPPPDDDTDADRTGGA